MHARVVSERERRTKSRTRLAETQREATIDGESSSENGGCFRRSKRREYLVGVRDDVVYA